jgi:hypothetical protein
LVHLVGYLTELEVIKSKESLKVPSKPIDWFKLYDKMRKLKKIKKHADDPFKVISTMIPYEKILKEQLDEINLFEQ